MLLKPPGNSSAAFPAATAARPAVQALGASRIREVANAGMGRSDILPFWFGEPDETTPAFIRDAAKAALDAGDTFYTQNLGLPALREGIAHYLSALHGPIDAERIAITSSGVSALMLLSQLIINPGDRVAAVIPLWPNLIEIPKILGAEVVSVPLRFASHAGLRAQAPQWELDVQQLLDALTPGTKAVFINSPNNPTGWVITREQQQVILDHCRRHGIWIVADDVYERLVYDDAHCAPSFFDIAESSDRLISANSFSKSWLMTGWRLGWLAAPAALMSDLGKLIEYNTSCAPGFVQRAGLVALERGEEIIAHSIARYRTARDLLFEQLDAASFRKAGVIAPRPKGAMYLFFRVENEHDTLALCKRLVAEAGLGLAPGSAFGPEGEGYIRWCFASSPERLKEGVRRLERFLQTR